MHLQTPMFLEIFTELFVNMYNTIYIIMTLDLWKLQLIVTNQMWE